MEKLAIWKGMTSGNQLDAAGLQARRIGGKRGLTGIGRPLMMKVRGCGRDLWGGWRPKSGAAGGGRVGRRQRGDG